MTAQERIQEDIAARIKNDPFFADFPVLLVRRGVTDNEAKLAIGARTLAHGKQGIAIIVLMPSRVSLEWETPGPVYEFEIVVRALTLPRINNTPTGWRISAEELSEKLDLLLNFFISTNTSVIAKGAEPFVNDDGAIGYDCAYKFTYGLNEPRKVLDPKFTENDDGTISISCPDGDAVCHFTVDDSYPGLDAGAFTEAFERPPAQTLIRTIAYAEGRQASNLMELFIS